MPLNRALNPEPIVASWGLCQYLFHFLNKSCLKETRNMIIYNNFTYLINESANTSYHLIWLQVNNLKSSHTVHWIIFLCCRSHFDFLAWHAHWLPNNCHCSLVASDELLTVSDILGRSPKTWLPCYGHLNKLCSVQPTVSKLLFSVPGKTFMSLQGLV